MLLAMDEDKDGEKALLVQLRDGSYEAFETIYHRYKVRLASSMLKLLKSVDLVDDILQDLFIRLWENREKIDPELSIQAYLFRIAQNLAYDTFRKASKDRLLFDRIYGALLLSESNIEERIVADEERRLLEAAIALLPPKRREVFVLCKLESKSYEEVSRLLNISLSTINDHIYKANLFLKQQLTQHALSLILIFLSAVG